MGVTSIASGVNWPKPTPKPDKGSKTDPTTSPTPTASPTPTPTPTPTATPTPSPSPTPTPSASDSYQPARTTPTPAPVYTATATPGSSPAVASEPEPESEPVAVRSSLVTGPRLNALYQQARTERAAGGAGALIAVERSTIAAASPDASPQRSRAELMAAAAYGMVAQADRQGGVLDLIS